MRARKRKKKKKKQKRKKRGIIKVVDRKGEIRRRGTSKRGKLT